MTAQAEARQLVELIAGPVRLGENVKVALARVAQLTGLGDRRVRGIWNGEARRIEAAEMDRLRQVALDARTREDAERAYRTHLARIQAYRQALRLCVEEHAGDVDLGRVELARNPAGSVDRSLDRGAR
ncbi:hypothetical protein [Methylobacterium nodulans]|uniref:Uncharacterized protein n=1 Tax=Methylobacterium nodulans (strain LMG 21967 / CNCM I-2342 / ORS 2060) TaxID=460265 RepID=B8IRR7_METNO|nr:hypothetical protein [Methylobacterium nodulans]ACL60617.1 hypothetical protein Mnod_5788 [Methylobacterium nodulans ORS 2060]